MATDLIATRAVIAERLEQLKDALVGLVDYLVSTDPAHINQYVEKLREQNPNLSKDELAKLVVSRKAIKQGLVGAIGGLGGVLSLPISVPAELVASWKIQVNMAMAVATVYGHDTSSKSRRSAAAPSHLQIQLCFPSTSKTRLCQRCVFPADFDAPGSAAKCPCLGE